MRMHLIISSSVPCLAVTYFPTLSPKWQDFRRKTLGNIQRVFIFPLKLKLETFLIIRRTERDIVTKVLKSSCKFLIILVRFY